MIQVRQKSQPICAPTKNRKEDCQMTVDILQILTATGREMFVDDGVLPTMPALKGQGEGNIQFFDLTGDFISYEAMKKESPCVP